MKTILLVTLRQPVAELLTQKLREVPGIQLIYEPDYAKFGKTVTSYRANTALIEVQESGEYGPDYCLALCAQMRKQTPDCRVLLLCPEQDATGVFRAVEAKRDGRIDDFLFYNATADYITSKLLVM